MTNGEKIQTILDVDRDCTKVHGENGTMTFTVTQDFWNAEYKESTPKNETLVSLDVYKQVAKERDIAIQQLHELGYDFGQKIELTNKNDCAEQNGCITCSLDDGDDCCRKLYEESMQEPTTKNNLGVDCIDRKKLIDWINVWDITPIIKKPLIRRIQGMPSVSPQPRWIIVEEKLPEIHNYTDKYLVTLERGGVYTAMFTECDGNHWWSYDDVIAWMPLPKSYNEVKK